MTPAVFSMFDGSCLSWIYETEGGSVSMNSHQCWWLDESRRPPMITVLSLSASGPHVEQTQSILCYVPHTLKNQVVMIPQTSCCSITPQALQSIPSSAAEVSSNAMLGILVYWLLRKYFSSIHKRTKAKILSSWRTGELKMDFSAGLVAVL